MPAVERDFDKRGRVTIPQDYIKEWGEKVVIHPNYCSAVLRPKKVSLENAIKSVEILLDDMRHQLELEKSKKGGKMCHVCGGRGYTREPCTTCNGRGWLEEKK